MSKAKPVAKPVEQVAAAPQAPVVMVPVVQEQPQTQDTEQQPAPQAPAPPAEPLDNFLRRIEGAHIDRDVYAVAATHPEATVRTWPGTYSGIRLSPGDVSVTYSDGSTE